MNIRIGEFIRAKSKRDPKTVELANRIIEQ